MAGTRKQHPESDALRRGIDRCLAHVLGFEGVIYRAVGTRYANRRDLLTGDGSKKFGGRWNPPRLFCALYGSLDPYAALAESLGSYGDYGIPPPQRLPLVLVGIEIQLQHVLDLTAGKTRRLLGVSEERMLEAAWQTADPKGEEGLTQAIGRLAWEAEVEALLVTSARLKNESNLVIFPDRLTHSSRLKIVNRRELPEPR